MSTAARRQSARLFAGAKKILPGGVDSPVRAFSAVGGAPPFIRRGRGARIEDEDGGSYVDFVMSWGPLIHGHAPAGLTRVLAAAAKQGTSFGAPTAAEVELGTTVRRLMPSLERVRFVNSGTEAAMSGCTGPACTCTACFVLGGDADDVRTVRETARFSVEKGIDTVQFLPLTPLPGTRQADQLRREGRLFLTLNPATGRYELDYGVGNSVLIRTRNINPLDLQRELLAAYEKFYSMKNIVSSVARGATAQTVVAKLVGRHLVRSGRGQVNEHMEWMRRHSFTKDWEEFVRSGQARSGVPALQV